MLHATLLRGAPPEIGTTSAVLSLVVSVVFGLVGFYIGAHIQVH